MTDATTTHSMSEGSFRDCMGEVLAVNGYYLAEDDDGSPEWIDQRVGPAGTFSLVAAWAEHQRTGACPVELFMGEGPQWIG